MAAPRLTGLSRARTARRAQELRAEAARDLVHRGRARLGKRTVKPASAFFFLAPVNGSRSITSVAATDKMISGRNRR